MEQSTLAPQINELHSMDEAERERALKPIRDHNFSVLLEWLDGRVRAGAQAGGRRKLLDVGCAHGWFLEKAAPRFDVLGLEPDEAVADRARQRNLPVRKGYFPQALQADEKFDVIVFNDVLEHIPDVQGVLRASAAHLQDKGLLVINAPDRRGLFYRVSKLFARAGRAASFERMWQVGLPSPHLYYFDSTSIGKIAAASGFKLVAERPLPSIVAKGLYERVHYARDVSRLRSAAITASILAVLPFLKAFHSDITVWVLERQPA